MNSDQVLLTILEGLASWALVLMIFGIPLSDWWTKRQIRKREQYKREIQRETQRKIGEQRFIPIKQSKYHSRD